MRDERVMVVVVTRFWVVSWDVWVGVLALYVNSVGVVVVV